jgi:glucose/arabinose dehydrogenase
MKNKFLATVMLMLVSTPALAYSVSLVAELDDVPWGIEFIDHDKLLINEKSGHIRLLDIDSGDIKLLMTIPDIYSNGQGGLLDVAKAPNSNHDFFFTYTKTVGKSTETVLAKAQLIEGSLQHWQDLLITNSGSGSSRHFGSRITFDDNNHVYFSVGDRGDRDNGQNTNNLAATIIRLNLDGSVPSNNPYVDNSEVRNEIWSYGHRNPQGIFFDSLTQNLWAIEHGPRGGDEINLIQPKTNYGWPVTSHGKEYWGPIAVGEGQEKEGIQSPALVYIPSIAPGSLILYRGQRYPNLNGHLLASALKLQHINVISIDNNNALSETSRILESLAERIRDITVSPDDYIYFSTDSGHIYRLSPN